MKFNIDVLDNQNGLSLYIRDGLYLSSLESMYVDKGFFGVNGLYVNRLIVNENSRSKGIATALLTEYCKLVDKKLLNVILEVNPYGDLNASQLIDFYKKFGFREYVHEGLLIRRHN